MDAISFKTPYDEGEDVYNGTEIASWMMKTERGLEGQKGLTKHWMILNITWTRPGLDLSRQLEEEETKILSHDLVC